MTNEQKPREFWVCSKKMVSGGFYYAEEKEMQPDLYPHYIHVIEYSAVDKLRKRINELEEIIYHKDNKIRELELGKSILKNERDHFLDLYKRKVLEGVLT